MSDWVGTVDGQFVPWSAIKRISIEEVGLRWVDGEFWQPLFGTVSLPNARQVVGHDHVFFGETNWCLALCDDEEEAREFASQLIEDCEPLT